VRRRSSDSTAVAAAACLRWCCRKKNERNDHGAKGTSDNESCTCQERRTLHTFGESVHGIGMALSSLSAAEAKSWAFILYLLFVVALFFIMCYTKQSNETPSACSLSIVWCPAMVEHGPKRADACPFRDSSLRRTSLSRLYPDESNGKKIAALLMRLETHPSQILYRLRDQGRDSYLRKRVVTREVRNCRCR
jgi:hypothetical protein